MRGGFGVVWVVDVELDVEVDADVDVDADAAVGVGLKDPDAEPRKDGPAVLDPSSPGHLSLDRIVPPNPASRPRSITFRNVSYTLGSSGLIPLTSRNCRTVSLAVFPVICFDASCSSRSMSVDGTEMEDATVELVDGLERYLDKEAGVR